MRGEGGEGRGDGEGGGEEDLSNERKGLLRRGHTDRHTGGHCDSMTESAQWADSVKSIELHCTVIPYSALLYKQFLLLLPCIVLHNSSVHCTVLH